MGEAVSETGVELGSAVDKLGRNLDVWVNKLESEVEKLLPGWRPQSSPIRKATQSRAPIELKELSPRAAPCSMGKAASKAGKENSARSHQDWGDWSDFEGNSPNTAAPSRQACISSAQSPTAQPCISHLLPAKVHKPSCDCLLNMWEPAPGRCLRK